MYDGTVTYDWPDMKTDITLKVTIAILLHSRQNGRLLADTENHVFICLIVLFISVRLLAFLQSVPHDFVHITMALILSSFTIFFWE